MFDILTHNTQILKHAFRGLKLSLTQLSDSQRDELEKLGMTINRLGDTLAGLLESGELINRVMLHDVRNQISVASTRAQLLQAHNAGAFAGDSTTYLDTIVKACDHIIAALSMAAQRS